ncbi:hypothetical protein W97_06468 [Coniosporium apollinis CBS 100218]|uniref:Uncharacterized protein n=1 Tax=Coniosporium apollinis (strain CBS 100218) TaxID=1168221 RepID=R7YZ35_CONA1|nr:uncharacterized protein W97_06468 [Coniosporium apollinis CBS 100218]EON67215.1 hypothetical protein W97_06468 [Coniosporium apollinis CBS 100218]
MATIRSAFPISDIHLDSAFMPSNYNSASSRRSSSFSSNFSSDSDFVSARSTPAVSVSPHRYDFEDLPPTYEQVQAEGLDPVEDHEHYSLADNHAGANNLRVHRLVWDDNETYPLPTAEDDAEPNAPAYTATDPTLQLLDQALQFTRHQPQPDVQNASRLGRRIVVPPLETSTGFARSTNSSCSTSTQKRGCCGRNKRQAVSESDSVPSSRGGCCRRRQASVPSSSCRSRTSFPSAPSREDPEFSNQATIPFARAYSKALHAHGISPAEFIAFIDGLNTLSLASPAESLAFEPSDSQSLALAYLSRANAAFFAPRGLQVRLATLSAIVDGLDVPSKFSRTTLLARATSPTADAIDRAQTLEPWVEPLDFSVPELSAATIELRQMAARLPLSGRRVQRAESAPTVSQFAPPTMGPNGFPLDNKQPFPSIQLAPALLPPRPPAGRSLTSPSPSSPETAPPHPETWQEWTQRWQTRALALGLQAEAWSRDVSAQADALGQTIALRAETYGRGVQYGPSGLWGASGERNPSESSGSGWCGRKGSAASWAGPRVSRESGGAAVLSRPSVDGSVISSSGSGSNSSDSSISRTPTTTTDTSTTASTSVPDIARINSRFEEQVKAITIKAEQEQAEGKAHYAEISKSKQRALEKAAQEKTKAEVKLEALRLKAEIELAKKEAKKAAKAEKCAEKKKAREERRGARRELKEVRRAAKVGVGEERNMVWLVVENLDAAEKVGGAVGTVVYEGT